MTTTPEQWIWQHPLWPKFEWQDEHIQSQIRTIRSKIGCLLGKHSVIDREANEASLLNTLVENILSSSLIEGEQLNPQSLRSSLAKRLGLKQKLMAKTTPRSEGLAEITLDAINNEEELLTLARLLQWHHWLFPDENKSIWYDIQGGQLRGMEPMQVVSGRMDKPRVHFEAPPRAHLEPALTEFIKWFNDSRQDALLDPLLRAAISHFWFITLHPFEDGNGRITRALTDLALAQNDKQAIVLYALSSAILNHREAYYRVLESSQRNNKTVDITAWLCWFLSILDESLEAALYKVNQSLLKTVFWQKFVDEAFLKEQKKIINCMLDEGVKCFTDGISAQQYKKIAKVSKATATRHLADLVEKGCIEKLPAGGRSTRYWLKKVF